ncbi:TIGR00730 family Rossman fold protein [Streptomyces sp. NPDC002742]|uniref:LOG family protein n=1 Tax=Streptomyces sp. NPDC002742 TaxID=3364663 RepID=UPI00367605BA
MRRGLHVGVFGSSGTERAEEYLDLARSFGSALAARGAVLVYGASGAGLMGTLAGTAFDGGGAVIGIVPHALQRRESVEDARGEIFVVRGEAERFGLLHRTCDAFAFLPGGMETLSGLLEMAMVHEPGSVAKPIVLVNIGGHFAPLLELLDQWADGGYISSVERSRIHCTDDVETALSLLGCGAGLSPDRCESGVT